jgi:hypothetical protein
MINNPFKPLSQKSILLSALLYGSVTTGWMIKNGMGAHTRRVSDVREYLRSIGYDIEATRIRRGSWSYQIVKIEIKRSPLSELWEKVRRFFISSPVLDGTMGGRPRQGVLNV